MIAYLNKRGGTHSQRLSDLTAQVWEWCLTRRITLQEKHIPCREKKGVDKESRRGADPSDWVLFPEVFQEICCRWGPLDVDLFVARQNAQMPRFYIYRLDPLAEAVETLGQKWTALHPCAFPPFILLGRVLQKIRRDRVHQAKGIAPVWQNQHWYPMLTESISDLPLILLQTCHLLINPAGEPHPLIQQGHLESHRARIYESGFYEAALDLIAASWRSDTEKAYNSAWKQWRSWCEGRNTGVFLTSVTPVVEFIVQIP